MACQRGVLFSHYKLQFVLMFSFDIYSIFTSECDLLNTAKEILHFLKQTIAALYTKIPGPTGLLAGNLALIDYKILLLYGIIAILKARIHLDL